MTSDRFARSLLLSLVLGAPFLLAAHAASGFVAPFSNATVAALVRVTTPLAGAATPTPDAEPLTLDGEGEAEPAVIGVAAKAPSHAAPKPKPKSGLSAVFVSKATVLQLAKSAARPRGSFVAETPEHPAGLRLSGVSALGIGVQDGDILIEALGITPRSPGQVIGAIIEARAKEPRFLSGTLARRGQRIPITVEQPYADASSARASELPAPAGELAQSTYGSPQPTP